MALINYLTRIQIDFGALALLGAELDTIGMRRPLIVTDKGLVALGLTERLMAALPDAGAAALFDGTPENPRMDETKMMPPLDRSFIREPK